MIGRTLVVALLVGAVPSVIAVESNLALPDTANFLDVGLTALGLITALVTTILRRRLDAENNTRDFLTYLKGQRGKYVNVLDVKSTHSLSKGLVLVEEHAVTWAQQLFSYYGATTYNPIALIRAVWLHPSNYPPGLEQCKCPVKCKCLLLRRVEGVSEHLVAIASAIICRVDDTFDAILCVSCIHYKCHGSANTAYQGLVHGKLGGLGIASCASSSSRTLIRSVAQIFGEGGTGLILLEPANEESVTWSSTILEASTVKDADDRGNENPFTKGYKEALAGVTNFGLKETKYDASAWWLSRVCAFTISCALVVLFRIDPFSSILLARRSLRGYVVDSTQTKLPLLDFCSSAAFNDSGEGLNLVLLRPRKGKYSLPVHSFLLATSLEVIVLPLWLTFLAITPWFSAIGSSYLNNLPVWATAVCCSVVLPASCVNIVYFWRTVKREQLRWAVLTATCGFFDTSVICLSVLIWAKVVRGHWFATAIRGLMMMGAVVQWILGVEHLPSITATQQGISTIFPYALTYLRLLALVSGGGRWA